MQTTLRPQTTKPKKRKSLIGQIVVLLLGIELLCFSNFLNLTLPTSTYANLSKFTTNCLIQANRYLPPEARANLAATFPILDNEPSAVDYSTYIPLCPISSMVGYMLGPSLGLIAILVYFIGGLIGGAFSIFLFAEGGGIHYFIEPSFGYLIGSIASTYVAARLTLRNNKLWMRLLCALLAVGSFHFLGLTYLISFTVITTFAESFSPPWQNWLFEEARNLTWHPLPYDLSFTIAFLALGLPLKNAVGMLCAPDIGQKQKGSNKAKDQTD
jgi:biotin transporter BioY